MPWVLSGACVFHPTLCTQFGSISQMHIITTSLQSTTTITTMLHHIITTMGILILPLVPHPTTSMLVHYPQEPRPLTTTTITTTTTTITITITMPLLNSPITTPSTTTPSLRSPPSIITTLQPSTTSITTIIPHIHGKRCLSHTSHEFYA